MVFTIPKRLRIFYRYDRRLLGEPAGCACKALRLYFTASFDGAAVSPGAVGFVQTAGELLNFHPHVHVLVTDGGFTPDGNFRPLAWFDSRQVERLFRAEVLRMLLGKELISEAIVDPNGPIPGPWTVRAVVRPGPGTSTAASAEGDAPSPTPSPSREPAAGQD